MIKIYSFEIQNSVTLAIILLILWWAPIPEPFPLILMLLSSIYFNPFRYDEYTLEDYEKRFKNE
jgi:uncharacterized protein involved in cysteine biosynthesis